MPLPAASQSGAYTARGQEPGWLLTITDQTVALSTAAGERFEAANPNHGYAPSTLYDLMLNGKPVRIAIEPQICRDTMSGMPHPDRVTISGWNGVLNGCGGAPRALLGTDEWSITEIGSSPVLADTAPTIVFLDDNAVAGSGSCNRFRGGFKLTGEGLTIEQLAIDHDGVPRSGHAAGAVTHPPTGGDAQLRHPRRRCVDPEGCQGRHAGCGQDGEIA